MGFFHGSSFYHSAHPPGVTDGLVFYIDASKEQSYNGSGTWNSLVGAYPGTLTNGPTYTSAGINSYFSFDGTNDFISYPSTLDTDPTSFYTGSFSLEHTFQVTGYQASNYFGITNVLINKGPASTYNYKTQVNSATSVRFTKRTAPESLQSTDFTVPTLTDKITHLVFVINSSGTSVSCYVDGSFIGAGSITGLVIEPRQGNTDPFIIGGLASTQYTNFIGNIYQIGIYNKELTFNEISKNYSIIKKRYGL